MCPWKELIFQDDDESYGSDLPELTRDYRPEEERLGALYGYSSDAGKFVKNCLENAKKEGFQARCDASGTLHVFSDANVCVLNATNVEMVEMRYSELRGKFHRFLGKEERASIFVDLPTPMSECFDVIRAGLVDYLMC